jgi:hypothetical protein
MTTYAIDTLGYWHIIHKTAPMTALCQEKGSRLSIVTKDIAPPNWAVCRRCKNIQKELKQ